LNGFGFENLFNAANNEYYGDAGYLTIGSKRKVPKEGSKGNLGFL